MKHLVVLLLPLLTISLPHSIGEATQQLVYDTEGHELSSDSSYYILPADKGIDGGLKFLDEFMSCTFFVGLQQGDRYAIPIQFMLPSDGAVGLSTNVTVKFLITTECVESMHWYVTNHSPMSSSELTKHVATGKRESQIYIPPSVFRIERFGDTTETGYKLVWCSKEGPCKDVGIQSSMEKNYLVTSDMPLAVVFKKTSVS